VFSFDGGDALAPAAFVELFSQHPVFLLGPFEHFEQGLGLGGHIAFSVLIFVDVFF
jgi:hypothetical protein